MNRAQLSNAHGGRHSLASETGAALVFALLGLLALTVLGLSLTGLGIAATTATVNERDTVEALAIADAGIAHAKKLILWKEWASLNQFLQNDAGANAGDACTGDELVDAPASPLPTGYPTDAADFVPEAGRPFGRGSYRVFVCDDDETDIDLSTTPPTQNFDPNVDVNHRILVRSIGTGPTGATAAIELVVAAQELPAVIVNGGLNVPGSPNINGGGGAVHANGPLEIEGNPCAQQYYAAVATITVEGNSVGTGAGCSSVDLDVRPESAPLNLPVLTADTYKAMADYWLENDGTARNPATGLAIPLPLGWSWSNAAKTWSSNSNIPQGTYWVNANVVVGGSPGTVATPLPLTLLATLSIDIGGSPKTVPDLIVSGIGILPVGISAIAGTDLKMAGNSSQGFTGIYYAAHQLNVAGSPTVNGQLLAFNAADTPYLPGNTNKVPLDASGLMVLTGSPTVNFSGGGIASTRGVAWRECRASTADPCGPLWGGNP
jgi:hypothetical protein